MRQFIVTECKQGWVVEKRDISGKQYIANETASTASTPYALGTLMTSLARKPVSNLKKKKSVK